MNNCLLSNFPTGEKTQKHQKADNRNDNFSRREHFELQKQLEPLKKYYLNDF